MIITELYKKTESLYEFAIKQRNASHPVAENPYHRKFNHPRLAYEFIMKYSTRQLDREPKNNSPLLATALIHDLTNLFAKYVGHESLLVSIMSDIEIEHGDDNPFNQEIKSLYGHQEVILRSIPDKKLHSEAISLLNWLYESYKDSRDLESWDKIKLLVLATITSYLGQLYDSNVVTVSQLIERIENKENVIKDTDVASLVTKESEEILESPQEYYLFDQTLVRLIKRYSYLHKADTTKISKEVFTYRFSDFASYFGIKEYDLLNDDIAVFLETNSQDPSYQSSATKFLKGVKEKGWYIHQIRLGLNLYILLGALTYHNLHFLRDNCIKDMESVNLELITRVWGIIE